jgi:hypothetical protein
LLILNGRFTLLAENTTLGEIVRHFLNSAETPDRGESGIKLARDFVKGKELNPGVVMTMNIFNGS